MSHKHVYAIPAYGDSPYLESCIKSLKAQNVTSPVILCTSTPSPFLGAMAEKYDLPYYIREGKSNIRDDWNYAYSMADAEFVTIAHQDDMYCKNYGEELLKAAEKYPDMTVFTSDYAIVKNKKVITGDKMLWVKRLLRLPLRFHILCGLKWIKIMPLVLGNPICCPATTNSKKRLGEPLDKSEYQNA